MELPIIIYIEIGPYGLFLMIAPLVVVAFVALGDLLVLRLFERAYPDHWLNRPFKRPGSDT